MQCSVLKEHITETLSHADRVATKSSSLPVLACVLLRVEKNTLTLIATNLEVGVAYSVPAQACTDGVSAVPAGVLLHVVSALPNGSTVTFSKKEGFLEVVSAGSKARIAVQDESDFPVLPKVENGVALELPVKGFVSALQSVAYCASSSLVKPELASVYINPNNNVLTAVATDSFRLAEKKVPLKKACVCDPFLIPAKSVPDIVRVLERIQGEEVSLLVSQHQLSVEAPGVYATFRLTAGSFPDYTQIFPKEFMTEVSLLKADLDRVLRKQVPFSDSFNKTTVRIAQNEDQITLHTENTTVGESTDTIPATKSETELEIRFNHRYLLEALHSITTDSIVLQFSGPARPTLVRPKGDETFIYLVMPMNR